MPPPPVSKRLLDALGQEAPGIAVDESIVSHLATSLEGEGPLPSAANIVNDWGPFLISLGACKDDDAEARGLCERLLRRLREAAAAPPGGPQASEASRAQETPPSDEDAISSELGTWLTKLRLVKYEEDAKAWCLKMGAVNLAEVFDNWEDFASDLKLKPLERKRVEKEVKERATQQESSSSSQSCVTPHAQPEPQPPPPAPAPAPPSSYAGDERTFGPENDRSKYTLLEELGMGATATVYRCRCKGADFAVKTISLAKLRLQRDFKRIQDKLHREVSILFALQHPRIVSLHDIVEEPDKLHLIMELVEGGPEGVELFDYIVARGSFEEPVAKYVFLQIVEGLTFIHSKGVVYRDLKPENILVDERASKRHEGLFEVKLSDFGHSKLINDGYSTALTRVGTPQYWAPEVNDPKLAARGYDFTVDLWSLGVVLYVMLIGAYPFDGVEERIEKQIMQAKFNFRSQAHRREVSTQAQDLCRSLIKSDPKKRLPLEGCRSHAWVKSMGGPLDMLDRVSQPWEESNRCQESIWLPYQPTKDVVEVVRRDLHQWMTKFKTSALVKNCQVVATPAQAQNPAEARHELQRIVEYHFGSAAPPKPCPSPARGPLPTVPERKSFRLIRCTLRVEPPPHGAGLELSPESGGMRVEKIYERPGQQGLLPRDLITKINEVSMRGAPEKVEEIFATHFEDGAEVSVRRECV